MLKKIISSTFFVFFIFSPAVSFGQIIFSEIMYDPEGTDSGYEWIEIYNNSSHQKNLEKYLFCEGKPICRPWVKELNNDFIIQGNSYAIITDDREKFLEKNDFDGLILVSTGFILTNTGELLQIKNKDGLLDDSLSFNPVSGGGNGNTLSVFDKLWKNSQSTPGKKNVEKKIEKKKTKSPKKNDDGKNINTSYIEISDMHLGKKKLRAEIDGQGVIMAGSRVKFTGKAYGITGVEISGVEFLWNFGDGAKDQGQFAFHQYSFPGNYIVNLTVKSGNFTGDTRVRVKVIDPSLEISYVQEDGPEKKGFIKLKNNFEEVLNIEDWMISVDGKRFLIPDNTYIDKNSEIIFSANITNLYPTVGQNKNSKVSILFPNGEIFFSYDFEKIIDDNEENILVLENTREEEKEKEIVIRKVLKDVGRKVNLSKKIKTKEEIKFDLVLREKVLKQGAENLKKQNKQEANILTAFSNENREGFLKSNWPFLAFLSILGILIFIVLYLRKEELLEGIENEEKIEENEDDLFSKEVKKEAKEFEIKERKE